MRELGRLKMSHDYLWEFYDFLKGLGRSIARVLRGSEALRSLIIRNLCSSEALGKQSHVFCEFLRRREIKALVFFEVLRRREIQLYVLYKVLSVQT